MSASAKKKTPSHNYCPGCMGIGMHVSGTCKHLYEVLYELPRKRGCSKSLCLNCGKRKMTNQYMVCDECVKEREARGRG